MQGELNLSCRTENPVDALSRILLLIARTSIELDSVRMDRETGERFRLDITLQTPLPMAADQLVARVSQMPSILEACCAAVQEAA